MNLAEWFIDNCQVGDYFISECVYDDMIAKIEVTDIDQDGVHSVVSNTRDGRAILNGVLSVGGMEEKIEDLDYKITFCKRLKDILIFNGMSETIDKT